MVPQINRSFVGLKIGMCRRIGKAFGCWWVSLIFFIHFLFLLNKLKEFCFGIDPCALAISKLKMDDVVPYFACFVKIKKKENLHFLKVISNSLYSTVSSRLSWFQEDTSEAFFFKKMLEGSLFHSRNNEHFLTFRN